MDYILLLATARIAGVFVPRLRLAAGAAAGAAYAVCAVLPATAFLKGGVFELAAGLGMLRWFLRPARQDSPVAVVFGWFRARAQGL